MAASRTRNTPAGSVGLDLDGGFLSAVQAGDGRIHNAISVELPRGVIEDGEVVDPDGLASTLKEIFRAGTFPKDVRLGVANQQIVVRQLELPKIDDDKEFDAAVRFQAADAIAMPLDEAVIDYQRVGTATDGAGRDRTNVVVVAARESMIERLVQAVRAAGLRPEGIDLNAFALVRALGGDASPGHARVYCHLGALTNLAIAVGPSCLFTRALSTKPDELGTIDAFAIAEEIRLSIDFYLAQTDAPPVSELVLSGPGAAADGLAEQLGSLTGLASALADPLGSYDRTSLPAGENPHRHTVALGLAMGAAA